MHPYLMAAVGGILIGLGAAVLLFFQGRIAGISGIVGGLLVPREGDASWRAAFLAGLLGGGYVYYLLEPAAYGAIDRSLSALGVAGLLVGFGTRLGAGCTSGHGVCGLSRFSARSLVAVITFMFTGAVSVWLVEHFLGGTL